MKIKTMILSCLAVSLVLPIGYRRSRADLKADKSCLKIGVVSVREIFRNCKRSNIYKQEVIAERQKIQAKLEQLSKESDAGEASLKTLKPGSSDYLAQYNNILQKKAEFQTTKKFYEQSTSLKEQQTTEEIYKAILQAVKTVAQQKDLDLVFEKSEPALQDSSPRNLDLAMSTHKLLYSKDCFDITDEVLKQIDAKQGEETKAL